jgi:uncharacterized protein YjbI with pentapeptide repeats
MGMQPAGGLGVWGMEAERTIQMNGTKRTIKAEAADLSGSSFKDVDLSGATFNDVNIAGARIADANLSDWDVHNVKLCGLRISNADLRGTEIVDSLMAGMTIDGIAIEDLLDAYRAFTKEMKSR